MVDTDASELAPEAPDPEEVTRARFEALRDRLLDTAEIYMKAATSLSEMSDVARLVSGAASANAVVETHSIRQLEQQKQVELSNYLSKFGEWFKALEDGTNERFVKQQEWVERELRARGVPPAQNASVLSLVPKGDGPEAAG